MDKIKICAVICESSTEAALTALWRAARSADLAELRADYLPDPNPVRLLATRPLPVIFTCRPRRHGGLFSGREAARLAVLRAAVQAGADYVDIEDDVDFSAVFTPPEAARAIVSYHNFECTPDPLEDVYQRLSQTPAGVLKIATQANTLRDAWRVLDLLQRPRQNVRPLIACAMGPRGLFTRVLGPQFGSFLTYAAMAKDRASAPGQLSLQDMTDLYRLRAVGPATRIIGLLGTPLGHSLSPIIHNAAFHAMGLDYLYVPFDADDPSAFWDLAERLPLYGLSVTVPYKIAVCSRLESMDPVATAAGAVNTAVRTPSGWAGFNTDVDGFLAPLLQAGALPYSSAIIVGAGGAARAAAYALRRHGLAVRIIARRVEAAEVLARTLGADYGPMSALREPADLLVNTTPVGMYPRVDETPVPLSGLGNKKAVYDLVYNPLATRLLQEAASAGCAVIHGLEMFLAQAVRQFQLWTGREAPVELMRSLAIERLSAPGFGMGTEDYKPKSEHDDSEI